MKKQIRSKLTAVILAAVLLAALLPAGTTTVSALEPITIANVSITLPAEDGHPDFAPVSDEEDKYSAVVESWYLCEDPYPDLNNESVFESGKEYALRLRFEPKSGYEFAEDATFTVNKQQTSCYGSSAHREIRFEPGVTEIDVTSGFQLRDALNRNMPVKAINIVSNITVNADCTIRFDEEHLDNYYDTVITINKGVVVKIEDGGLMGSFWPSYEGNWENGPIPNGKLINNGGIIIKNGGGVVADFDTNNGEIIVEAGGECVCPGVNNGTVYVEAGGVYQTTQGGDSRNNGTINIAPGATMVSRFGSTIINAEGGTINLDGTFICGCVGFDEDVIWFSNEGTVNGQGSIVLNEVDRSVAPVSDMDALIEKMMGMLGQEKRFENWDDVNIYRLREVGSFEDLAAEFPGDRVVAGEQVAGDMDVMVLIETSMAIPEGASIETMGQIFVSGGATLTVESGALLECAIENNANVVVKSGGKLYSTMGGSITNRGTLTVEAGGEIKSQMGGEIINGEGASIALEGDMYCGCIGFGEGSACWLYNSGAITGSGKIYLYEADHGEMPVADMPVLAQSVRDSIPAGEDPVPEVLIVLPYTPGDINGDEAVNNKDLTRLFQYLSDWEVEVDEEALDVNGDGSVNNKDLTRLFQYLSDWDVEIF
ncbi:MAG: hypothetical protein IKZ47_02225 [Clostridia bacterium]|nr:hypothetical protein [Clostridia bacterium]